MKYFSILIISLGIMISCQRNEEQFTPTLQRPEKKENNVDKYFQKENDVTAGSKDEFSDLKQKDESGSADNAGKSKFGCSVK